MITRIALVNVHIDPKRFECRCNDHIVSLTQRELDLILFFYNHNEEVVTRFTLLNQIWGINYEGTTRTLDQHIAKLRQKIEVNPADPKHLITVHGVGYRFFCIPRE